MAIERFLIDEHAPKCLGYASAFVYKADDVDAGPSLNHQQITTYTGSTILGKIVQLIMRLFCRTQEVPDQSGKITYVSKSDLDSWKARWRESHAESEPAFTIKLHVPVENVKQSGNGPAPE